jgi:hypothetical protein
LRHSTQFYTFILSHSRLGGTPDAKANYSLSIIVLGDC